jgi:hypothetical protein
VCKRLREDAQNLKEENTKLEGMIESRDEFNMEITTETKLDHMGQDAQEEEEDEDGDDGGNTATLSAATPSHVPAHPTVACEANVVEEEDPMGMVPEQDDQMPQPHLYRTLMGDRKESPSRMMDDLDDMNDLTEVDYDVDEWFPEDGSNDQD